MVIAIRYYTKSGNTEKLAKAIGEALAIPAVSIAAPLEEKVDILLLGCSYYAFDMDPEVKKFLSENRENIGKVACFGTSAMMKSMAKPMKKITDSLSIPMAEEEFHCRGSFGPANKGRPNEKDLKAAKDFAIKLMKRENAQ